MMRINVQGSEFNLALLRKQKKQLTENIAHRFVYFPAYENSSKSIRTQPSFIWFWDRFLLLLVVVVVVAVVVIVVDIVA